MLTNWYMKLIFYKLLVYIFIKYNYFEYLIVYIKKTIIIKILIYCCIFYIKNNFCIYESMTI